MKLSKQVKDLVESISEATSKGLVAVASSEEDIKKLITKFFYGTEVTLKPIDDITFEVHNSKGNIKEYIVKLVKGRYRFERSPSFYLKKKDDKVEAVLWAINQEVYSNEELKDFLKIAKGEEVVSKESVKKFTSMSRKVSTILKYTIDAFGVKDIQKALEKKLGVSEGFGNAVKGAKVDFDSLADYFANGIEHGEDFDFMRENGVLEAESKMLFDAWFKINPKKRLDMNTDEIVEWISEKLKEYKEKKYSKSFANIEKQFGKK